MCLRCKGTNPTHSWIMHPSYPNFLRRWQWKSGPQKVNIFPPTKHLLIFTINEEDSSRHFNSRDQFKSIMKNSCFMTVTYTLYDLEDEQSAMEKNLFEGYVLSSLTSVALVEGRLNQREIFLGRVLQSYKNRPSEQHTCQTHEWVVQPQGQGDAPSGSTLNLRLYKRITRLEVASLRHDVSGEFVRTASIGPMRCPTCPNTTAGLCFSNITLSQKNRKAAWAICPTGIPTSSWRPE